MKSTVEKGQIKELAIEVWGYVAEHTEIGSKNSLPNFLLEKIDRLGRRCPLCELSAESSAVSCAGCIMGVSNPYCLSAERFYFTWCEASTDEVRELAAQEIVNIAKAIKVG
jgi:hypothetical protein